MRTELFDEAFAALPAVVKNARPTFAMMLGSGWNSAADQMDIIAEVPYSAIPHLGGATVIGHSGRLLLARSANGGGGSASGGQALVFCGRRHWYEGAEWEAVVMPAEISRRLGVRDFLVTNAAGGIRKGLKPGDIVMLTDHIKLSHQSPLRGPHNPDFGPRFPDQSAVYSAELQNLIARAAAECGIAIERGVYVFAAGPTFETPAEIRAYGILGADVVGMSTVPEASVATACGMRVAGLSFVSNMAAGISAEPLTGDDVIECAKTNAPKLAALINAVMRRVVVSNH